MTRSERRAEWARLVSEQAASGKSARAFCRERAVNVARFYQWRKRLAGETGAENADVFVEVVARDGASGVRLRLNGDGTAEFVLERGFDEGTLRRAFAAVAG